jgi:hypothetical protein
VQPVIIRLGTAVCLSARFDVCSGIRSPVGCSTRRVHRELLDCPTPWETDGQDAGLRKAQNGLLDWIGIRRVSESLTAGGMLLALAAA